WRKNGQHISLERHWPENFTANENSTMTPPIFLLVRVKIIQIVHNLPLIWIWSRSVKQYMLLSERKKGRMKCHGNNEKNFGGPVSVSSVHRRLFECGIRIRNAECLHDMV